MLIINYFILAVMVSLILWMLKGSRQIFQLTGVFERIMFCVSFVLISYSVGFVTSYWLSTMFLVIVLVTFGMALLQWILPYYSLNLWNHRALNLCQTLFHLVSFFCICYLFVIIMTFEDKVNVDGYNHLVVNQLAKQIAQVAITLFLIIQLLRFIYVMFFLKKKN